MLYCDSRVVVWQIFFNKNSLKIKLPKIWQCLILKHIEFKVRNKDNET